MINLINGLDFSVVAFIGILFAFAFTCIAIAKLEKFLPRDQGRAFAHDGKLFIKAQIAVLQAGDQQRNQEDHDDGDAVKTHGDL